MHLIAAVREHTGNGARHHLLGSDGKLVEAPAAVAVEVIDGDGGYHLLRYDINRTISTETWHATLVEAKQEAALEYGIQDDDWREATRPPEGRLPSGSEGVGR